MRVLLCCPVAGGSGCAVSQEGTWGVFGIVARYQWHMLLCQTMLCIWDCSHAVCNTIWETLAEIPAGAFLCG